MGLSFKDFQALANASMFCLYPKVLKPKTFNPPSLASKASLRALFLSVISYE